MNSNGCKDGEHARLEYLEWGMLENRGIIVGTCVACGSTVAMRPGSLLVYKEWLFTYDETIRLMRHFMDNLNILKSLKQEILFYFEEGYITKKEMELEMQMLQLYKSA